MYNQLYIGVNCVPFNNQKALYRQEKAMQVLLANKPDNCEIINFCYANEKMKQYEKLKTIYLTRNSQDIGNNRPLPYIKEIMDALSDLCEKQDIFGYINSDILLTKDFFDMFKDEEAFVFSRTEITNIDSVEQFNKNQYKMLWGGDTHAGADGFFFRKEWWVNNSKHFDNDFILGESEWDTAYRHLIMHLTDNYVNKRELFHVYHDAKWTTTSIGAQNNIKLWEQVKNDFA